jgi:hypothetical protein
VLHRRNIDIDLRWLAKKARNQLKAARLYGLHLAQFGTSPHFIFQLAILAFPQQHEFQRIALLGIWTPVSVSFNAGQYSCRNQNPW